MKSWLVILALAVVGSATLGGSTGQQPTALPELNKHSAEGLQIECHPSKAEYRVGERVKLVCTITNATDTIKPIAWKSGVVSFHFLVTGAQKKIGWTGTLPEACPLIPRPLLIKNGPTGYPGEFVLYLPPHDSITFHLRMARADRPVRYTSRVVYHPLPAPWLFYDGIISDEDEPPWRGECLVSDPFTYEVLEDEEDSVT